MKSQDTAAALEDLRIAAGDEIPVICLQNGVENERIALRRFRNVYGVLVIMPANYVEPGIVDTTSWPTVGVLDIGRYPEGVDEVCERFVADIAGAGFASEANPKIMRLKYTKLNQNMVNALQAILPPDAEYKDITDKARAEAEACFSRGGHRLGAHVRDDGAHALDGWRAGRHRRWWLARRFHLAKHRARHGEQRDRLHQRRDRTAGASPWRAGAGERGAAGLCRPPRAAATASPGA